MTAVEATGRCVDCGDNPVRGQLVNEVETNSAPFWANVRCGPCSRPRARLTPAPAGFHARPRGLRQ